MIAVYYKNDWEVLNSFFNCSYALREIAVPRTVRLRSYNVMQSR